MSDGCTTMGMHIIPCKPVHLIMVKEEILGIFTTITSEAL